MSNVSIDIYPCNHFAGPFSCSGRHTCQALVDHLMAIIEERGTNLGSVCVVGVYGTNAVVGSIGGLRTLLEACLGTTVLKRDVSLSSR